MSTAPGEPIEVRLAAAAPSGTAGVLAFLAMRVVEGVEELTAGGAYRRSLRLPRGGGVAELAPDGDDARLRLWLDDRRDRETAVERCRDLLGLDVDPRDVLDALGEDPVIGALVRADPGRRVPGHVDGAELAVRTLLGQQISVAAARTHASRLVARAGEPLARPVGAVTHLFPAPAALVGVPVGLPRARVAALTALAEALASGQVRLDAAADRAETERRLLALPGIGPWSVAYLAMRALRDPDAFMESDLGVRRAVERLGLPGDPRSVRRLAEGWRPFRAYANLHLWALDASPPAAKEEDR